MKVTVLTADERIVSLDVEPDELVENLKAILEVETQVPLAQQQILFNGIEMPNTSRLNTAGVGENDLLMLVSARPASGPASSPASAAPTDLGLKPDGTAINPIALIRHLQGDPNIMRQLQESNRELFQAVSSNNVDMLQNLLRQQHQQKILMQQHRQHEIDLMNADPFDVEAQKKIEEAIQQKNVDENWEAALEYNPEAFARVIMLYVDMEVNGFPLKVVALAFVRHLDEIIRQHAVREGLAFVDSGAQSTIISKSCAERCGLLRLMDKRYRGIARGVGQSEIVGRIHVAPLKIGRNFYPCSFTVLDQPDLEFIFGLDMLRKHQCSIDLKDNVLRVGGGEISVPFLQENQLPLHLHDDKRLEEPSASGPSSSVVNVHPPAPIHAPGGPVSTQESHKRARSPQEAETDSKVQRLMELGFDRNTVTQALSLFNGNEEQAASYLFGGF